MSNILHTAISLFFNFLFVSFFVSMVFSFLPIPPSNPVRGFFDGIVRPIVTPLDRRIPPVGMFRLSFLIAVFAVLFAQNLFLAALPPNW